MALIKIRVNKHKAELVEIDHLATGSVGVDAVRVMDIDDSWAGFQQAAVFDTGGSVYYSLLEEGEADIPAAVLQARCFGLGLYGTRVEAGNEKRYTTN